MDFPGGPVVKNPRASAGGMGSIPSPRRSHMLVGATEESMHHNYWDHALQLTKPAHPSLQEQPSWYEAHTLQLE